MTRYVGPPTCLRKETWKVAPFCDSCGESVGFKVWFDNKRHCSPLCRPAWHLLPVVVCKLPGCDVEIVHTGAKGRPNEFCSDECRQEARAEDMRRRRRGEPTIDREVRGDPSLRTDWIPRVSEWDIDDLDGFIYLEPNGRPVFEWGVESLALSTWLSQGGDWPNMRSLGPPCGRVHQPTLGSWDPWDQVNQS